VCEKTQNTYISIDIPPKTAIEFYDTEYLCTIFSALDANVVRPLLSTYAVKPTETNKKPPVGGYGRLFPFSAMPCHFKSNGSFWQLASCLVSVYHIDAARPVGGGGSPGAYPLASAGFFICSQ
jgi:hypothetical protein